jgi:hypothetical protein
LFLGKKPFAQPKPLSQISSKTPVAAPVVQRQTASTSKVNTPILRSGLFTPKPIPSISASQVATEALRKQKEEQAEVSPLLQKEEAEESKEQDVVKVNNTNSVSTLKTNLNGNKQMIPLERAQKTVKNKPKNTQNH